ncbi:MAG: DUF1848 family protein [Dysgonomonas sp.]|uniref:DUF1848 domain-containing protein n=1 Tax=Dysgonomonas sp. TaxID=1891233 RepID=UPI0039E5BA2B
MIISASRRTDIPAFYSEWFFNRLQEGFVLVPNPRNPKQFSRISLKRDVVDCFVFWSKNPSAMIGRLDQLASYNYYFQFTLTPYQKDIEQHLPSVEKRIEIFQQLSDQIGKERIVWRYDPVFINPGYSLDYHINSFEKIASSLKGYTNTCIISFIDEYSHIRGSLAEHYIRSMENRDIHILSRAFSEIAQSNELVLQTCAEDIDLDVYSISHGACIDRKRIERILGCSLEIKKDKNQRSACNCIESIDIGTYDTCPHGCIYCYATTTHKKVLANMALHDKHSAKLSGLTTETDIIKEKKVVSLISSQKKLFE